MRTGRPVSKKILYISFLALAVAATLGVFASTNSTDRDRNPTIEDPSELQDDPFIRGDANSDGIVCIPDAVFILRYLVIPMSPWPSCMDAADANDDGGVGPSDPQYLINFLTDQTNPLPHPYPSCGVDTSADGLACDSHFCSIGGGPVYAGMMAAPDTVLDPGNSGYFQIVGSCPDTIGSYQIHMNFDTSALMVQSVTLSGCAGEGYNLASSIDSTQGSLTCIAYIFFPPPDFIPPFVDQPLANVWYTASTHPSYSDLELFDCVYGEYEGYAVVPELTDGSFVVSAEEPFIRGDANGDSLVDISDPLFLIRALFQGGPPPPCADAADATDDGDVRLDDATYVLDFLGQPVAAPPPLSPYPGCGIDPTPDTLTCDTHPCQTGTGPLRGGSMEAPYVIEYPGDSDSFQIIGSSPNTINACQIHMEFQPTFVTIDSVTVDGCVGQSGSYGINIDNTAGMLSYINQNIAVAPFTNQPLLNIYYTASPYSSTSTLDLTSCAYTIFINNSYYSLLPDLSDGTFHIPEESFFIFRTDSIPELPLEDVTLYGCEFVSAHNSVEDSTLQVCDTIMVHWTKPAELYCTWDTLHVISLYTVDIDSIAGAERQDEFNRCQCLWVDGVPWHVWACGHIGDIETWWVILAKNEETGNFFIRGDANGDGQLQMNDSRFILEYLYVPGAPDPPCLDAADVNDDMQGVRMSDAIYLLQHLYVPGSPQPPAPFPDCGPDLTNDCLNCAGYEPCE